MMSRCSASMPRVARDIHCPEPVCRARTDTGRAVFPLLSGVVVILRHPLAF
ncbi:hypothetical protein V1412_003532 [Salmonella enterica]|nr:hypothetical protein [Salmonella enterica]